MLGVSTGASFTIEDSNWAWNLAGHCDLNWYCYALSSWHRRKPSTTHHNSTCVQVPQSSHFVLRWVDSVDWLGQGSQWSRTISLRNWSLTWAFLKIGLCLTHLLLTIYLYLFLTIYYSTKPTILGGPLWLPPHVTPPIEPGDPQGSAAAEAQDQVAMAPSSGPLTSMWGIEDLRLAFPELEDVSFVLIDAAPWLKPWWNQQRGKPSTSSTL